MNVLISPQRFGCRVCGSTYHAEDSTKELCGACWGEFKRWRERTKEGRSDRSINQWMARRLMMDAERLDRLGIVGRCEAVSTAGHRRWLDGMDAQCRMRATQMRDGRRVCGKHAEATIPTYVGDEAHDPYTDLQRVMTTLACADGKFRKCLERAIALSSQHQGAPNE